MSTPAKQVSIFQVCARTAVVLDIPAAVAISDFRFHVVMEYLARNEGNKCRTARAMGVHRNTFSRWFNEFKKEGRFAKRKPMPVTEIAERAAAAGL
jgi:ActR/RegA family two-component response regulator